jgi:hypothetical protein
MPRRKIDSDSQTRTTTLSQGRIPLPRRDPGRATVQTGIPSIQDQRASASREKPQGHETEGSVPASEVRAPVQPSAVRIAYQMVRHALGKWGTTKVIALDLRREGDTVVLTPVSSRHRPLQHYIEVPFTSEVLSQLATALQELAAQARMEEGALRHRLLRVQRESEGELGES